MGKLTEDLRPYVSREDVDDVARYVRDGRCQNCGAGWTDFPEGRMDCGHLPCEICFDRHGDDCFACWLAT